MFLIDSGGRFVAVSPAFAEVLSHDSETLTGVPFASVVAESDGDLAAAATAVRENGHAVHDATGQFVTSEGELRTIEVEFVSDPSLSGGLVAGSVRRVGEFDHRATVEGTDDRFGALFELINDAVVEVEIVDVVPIVRTVNPAFESVFGYDAESIVGESLNEYIVPRSQVGQAVDFDQRTAEGKINKAVVTRKTDSGLRKFLYRGLPYDRGDGGQYGLAVYTDITDQKRRKRHHEVLHRVLRHNLRNATTVILGRARNVDARVDGDISREIQLLVDAAEDLVELSEQARDIERVFDDDVDRYPIDVAGICRRLSTSYRSETDATIETVLPARLPVVAGEFLPTALENLLENATEHGGATPRIVLSGECEGDMAVVRVEDDGPGIPEQERSAVFDEQISQLSHGSGLGLWLAKWVVEIYGGHIGYERTDGRTVIEVRLPLSDEA